jgi:hypothetical protein
MSLSTPYVPTVPQGNQQINNTQAPIEGNFQDIYDLLAINHVPFNTADTFGRHMYVNYVEQAVDPSTLSTEMALYSKPVNNDTNGAELFYRYPSSGTVVQLTGVTSSSSGGTSLSTGGYFTASGSIYLGTPYTGYWQYLSNNVLFMSFTVGNSVKTATTSPYTVTFPSGSYANGAIVPSFTQTPFNIQIAATGGGGVEGTSGTNVNYAVEIVNSTTCLVYYLPSSIPAGSIQPVVITVIGI